MSFNFNQRCPNCGALVGIVEYPLGVAGGKERENADCLNCGDHYFQQ